MCPGNLCSTRGIAIVKFYADGIACNQVVRNIFIINVRLAGRKIFQTKAVMTKLEKR